VTNVNNDGPLKHIVVRYYSLSRMEVTARQGYFGISDQSFWLYSASEFVLSGVLSMRSPQTAVAVAMFVTLAGTLAVAAQELKVRTVQGSVVDEDNRPVASAVVYLRDDRTNSVRTYITTSSGHYRFSWLGEYDDYDLEAHTQNFRSHRHTISQWDTRREFVIDLKLDKKEG
jgi:hypothetical protein